MRVLERVRGLDLRVGGHCCQLVRASDIVCMLSAGPLAGEADGARLYSGPFPVWSWTDYIILVRARIWDEGSYGSP